MNHKIKYLAVALIIAFSGCTLLEPVDENLLGEDRLNYDPTFAEGLLIKAYQDLVYQRSSTDMVTDDATHNYNSSQQRIATGEWSAAMTPTSRWGHYEHVLFVNKFISVIDNVAWKKDEESNQLFKDRNLGEALAMRALRHYWILQEHAGYSTDGVLLGVPYIDQWLEYNADFNIPRLTFAETVDRILADFDEALEYLPFDYNGDYSARPARYENTDEDKYVYIFGSFQEHRISGRIIKALKAKLHLMAASPSYLNDMAHYEKAAALAAELINDNGGIEGLDMSGHHNFYTFVEGDLGEYFWRKGGTVDLTSSGYEKDNFPPSLRGRGQINPSQNLVDAFYMANGYPATPENGFDPNQPYNNRDPRLKMYVLYNGNDLGGRQIITGTGGGDDEVNKVFERSTRTGYYVKKHTWQNLTINPDGTTSAVKKRDFLIRYTELYLLLAEAANEIGGPNHAVGGITATQIMRKIRNRALGIASDPYLDQVAALGKDEMRKLIRNERRLELCFEGHRFYDLRRWGQLNSDLPDIKGAYFNGVSYDLINVEPRIFPIHANYAPIPQSEVLKFSKLEQNNGW
jgi:starch-binding outer membrane protein, SusD/RagB family